MADRFGHIFFKYSPDLIKINDFFNVLFLVSIRSQTGVYSTVLWINVEPSLMCLYFVSNSLAFLRFSKFPFDTGSSSVQILYRSMFFFFLKEECVFLFNT